MPYNFWVLYYSSKFFWIGCRDMCLVTQPQSHMMTTTSEFLSPTWKALISHKLYEVNSTKWFCLILLASPRWFFFFLVKEVVYHFLSNCNYSDPCPWDTLETTWVDSVVDWTWISGSISHPRPMKPPSK